MLAELLGYSTGREAELVVRGGETTQVDFILTAQLLDLSAVVGSGTPEKTSKARLPFSVARVGSESLPAPAPDAIGSLAGRVAGARVVPVSQPGVASILLRSPASLYLNDPLVVLDGVPLTHPFDVSTLNLASVEVLRGPASSALYGSRGGAGVIELRSARGNALPPGQWHFRAWTELVMNAVPKPLELATHHSYLMNSQGEFLDSVGTVVPRSGAAQTPFRFQDQPYPGPNYDHYAQLLDPRPDFSGSVTTGYNTGNTSWLLRATRRETSGVMRGTEGSTRNDVGLTLDHRLLDRVSVSAAAFHAQTDRDDLLEEAFIFPFSQLMLLFPDADLLQPDPGGTRYIHRPSEDGGTNPLYFVAASNRESNAHRTLGHAGIRYDPRPWLGFDLNASVDRTRRQADVVRPSVLPAAIKTRLTEETDGFIAWAGASLTRTFGLLGAHASVRAFDQREDVEDAEGSGTIDSPDFVTGQSVTSWGRWRGYDAASDIDYAGRLILNAGIRRERDRLLDRWVTNYRAGASYRISAENWWPFESLDEVKLRYARGKAATRPSIRLGLYSFVLPRDLLLGPSGLTEDLSEQELGLDLVARRRLAVQLTYATRNAEGIASITAPPSGGFTGSELRTVLAIDGNNMEASIEARLIDRPEVSWSLNLTGDRSRHTVNGVPSRCLVTGQLVTEVEYRLVCNGQTLTGIHGIRFVTSPDRLPAAHAGSRNAFQVNDDGLVVPVGVGNTWRDGVSKQLWGTRVTIDGIEYDWGLPIPEPSPQGSLKIGDVHPDLSYGISSRLQWRNLRLYALLSGQVGGDVYNWAKQNLYRFRRHPDLDQKGKPEDLKKPTTYYSVPFIAHIKNARFVENGSHMKLRELSLKYRLDPQRIAAFGRLGLEEVTLSLTARNLLTLTGYSGLDPEVGTGLLRIEDFSYPIYRTLTAGLAISF